MNNSYLEFNKITINEAFCIKDCIFKSEDKAVLFSPFSLETLLCEVCVIDFITYLSKGKQKQSVISLLNKSHVEIIEKLISMKILLLKD